ncbi:hypothetical protein JCM16358_21390 [Halanaerocella petrolearia]
MQMKIERLTDNQTAIIKELVAIEEEIFGPGGLNQWGLVPFLRHGAVYVIYIDSQPVGVIEYMRDMDEINTAYLYGLAIVEEFQGQGLGKRLLDYSLEQLQQLGITNVELTVDPDNHPAIKLYRKFGFKQVDFHEEEYGLNEDRFIMELKL